ncbi:hypothetical protein FCV25MIE_04549 [Fagus crenata]
MKQEDEEIDVSNIVASKKTQPFCPFLLSNFDLFARPSRSTFDSDSNSKPPPLLRPSSLLSFRREDMSIGLLAKREARLWWCAGRCFDGSWGGLDSSGNWSGWVGLSLTRRVWSTGVRVRNE